jgi:uncharacterized protein YcbX
MVSRASLETIATWFSEDHDSKLTGDDIRQRLRVNIVVEGVPAFWEDRLLPEASEAPGIPFTIGGCSYEGVGPVLRCPVPTRDPHTGEIMRGFQRKLIQGREANLPPWSPRAAFVNGFYYATSKTRGHIGCEGNTIKVGDIVDLGPMRSL